MEQNFFTSPKRICTFIAIVALVAFVIIGIASYIQYSQGLPQIEVAIKKEFGIITSESSALRGIELRERVRAHTSETGDELSGYFIYGGELHGTDAQIQINWTGRKGSAHITKIQHLTYDSRLTVLWERKN